MKKIELICVGNLKFKSLKELEKEYSQKIKFFTSFDIKIIKDFKIADEAVKINKETQMIKNLLDDKDYVIALDRRGKKMDSLAFAKLLSDKISWHPAGVVFIIGGAAGLSNVLDNQIDLKLSFSEMTFAHDIFRILFLEQLYRAFTIIKGIKYHR